MGRGGSGREREVSKGNGGLSLDICPGPRVVSHVTGT